MADKQELTSKPALGRPPKPPGEGRTRRTVTFLTDREYQELVDIAQRNNISISSAAHKLLVLGLNSWH